jgi:aminoglycoside phosphotransferase (APT) family kinase protein
MAFVEGTSFEPLFDSESSDDVTVVAERMHHAAGVLAALHSLDPAALGLADEPRLGPADEVARWARLLGTVDAALVPGWEAVADALVAAEPPALAPAVVHGDFRLGNMLATGPSITAVVDWEIWSIGDPRVDVGWFLVNADPETYRRRTPYCGLLPTPSELARTYTESVGHDVPALEWFEALACFKSAATWSLIVKHNRRRPKPDPDLEEMAGSLAGLLSRATWLMR